MHTGENTMRLEVPDVRDVVTRMLEAEASFGGTKQEVYQWLKDHRRRLERNKRLVAAGEHMQVLRIFLPNLLIRGMRGEAGSKVHEELKKCIKEEADLRTDVYEQALQKAGYRWGAKGGEVIEGVVRIFCDEYGWDWERYFEEAEVEKETNFLSDKLLEVKYIGFKVRDLALSSFNENYIANDRHLVRVITRLGFLSYGFELLGDDNLEMGTDPAKKKNYLFLHRLALHLSALTGGVYSPSDLDRVFWHFGRSLCIARQPQCGGGCPVARICPTGRFRIGEP
jgi:endonuclease III